MKVLFLHKSLVIGGVETVLITYLNIFQKLGYSVDLHLAYDLDNENYRINELSQEINLSFSFNKTEFYKLEKKRKFRKNSILHKIDYELIKFSHKHKYQRDILSIISNQEYDFIIDFNSSLGNSISFERLRKITNAKIVRWCHSQIPDNELEKTLNLYNKFDKVIAVSDEMRSILSAKSPKLSNKLAFLHNPINLQQIKIKSELEIAESLPNDYLVVITRIVQGKGLDELINIYHDLRTTHNINNKLYIIGDGESFNALRKIISDKNLSEDCILFGKKENPYPYLKNAKLFLFTSESEGLPTVLLESMALGTPVVSMNCPTGPTEIIGKNNEYGKLIKLHDKESFCNAVYELLNDSSLYQHYVTKSFERSLDFSEENIEIKIKHLFSQLSK